MACANSKRGWSFKPKAREEAAIAAARGSLRLPATSQEWATEPMQRSDGPKAPRSFCPPEVGQDGSPGEVLRGVTLRSNRATHWRGTFDRNHRREDLQLKALARPTGSRYSVDRSVPPNWHRDASLGRVGGVVASKPLKHPPDPSFDALKPHDPARSFVDKDNAGDAIHMHLHLPDPAIQTPTDSLRRISLT